MLPSLHDSREIQDVDVRASASCACKQLEKQRAHSISTQLLSALSQSLSIRFLAVPHRLLGAKLMCQRSQPAQQEGRSLPSAVLSAGTAAVPPASPAAPQVRRHSDGHSTSASAVRLVAERHSLSATMSSSTWHGAARIDRHRHRLEMHSSWHIWRQQGSRYRCPETPPVACRSVASPAPAPPSPGIRPAAMAGRQSLGEPPLASLL